LFFYKKVTELLFCDLLKWHKHSHGASEEDDGRLISCCRRCWKPIYVDNDFKLIGECEDEDIKKAYKIVKDRYLTQNVQAQGQAGFTALSFELTVALAAMMNFEKPPCPLVPCSALLCNILIKITNQILRLYIFHLPL